MAQVFTILIGTPAAVLGQSSWPSYPNNGAISVTSGGSVGIGTSNPGRVLHVVSTQATDVAAFQNSSSTGFATILFLNDIGSVGFGGIGGSAGAAWANEVVFGSASSVPLVLTTANVPRVTITNTGNVGVGTTSPAYKLDVQGFIGAQDIYVASNALPDYVFDADYRNAPLHEVAAYIEQNHHLPGMPSAAEAEKNGLSVGEMQNKLLQKVEELTLHMIAAEKRNTELERQIRELKTQLHANAGSAYTPAQGEKQ